MRQIEQFKNVHVVVIPENNLGLSSSHIDSYVHDIDNVSVFHENNKDRIGIRKTEQNTDDYQICVEDMLRKGQIYFSSELFTTSKKFEHPDGEMHKAKLELREQLERYHWEVLKAKDVFGKEKIAMTGKMGGAQDDMYVAFAMTAYWGKVHKKETRALKRRRYADLDD